MGPQGPLDPRQKAQWDQNCLGHILETAGRISWFEGWLANFHRGTGGVAVGSSKVPVGPKSSRRYMCQPILGWFSRLWYIETICRHSSQVHHHHHHHIAYFCLTIRNGIANIVQRNVDSKGPSLILPESFVCPDNMDNGENVEIRGNYTHALIYVFLFVVQQLTIC